MGQTLRRLSEPDPQIHRVMQPVTPRRLYGVKISSSSSAVHPRWRLAVPRSPMQRRLHISRRFGFQYPTNHVGFVWFATVAMSYQRQQGPGVNTAYKGASRNLLMEHKFPRHEQRYAFDGRSGFRPRKTLAQAATIHFGRSCRSWSAWRRHVCLRFSS
jgi:hypothetical protein